MARGKITLYEVPSELRAKGAAETRKNTLQLLANPHLTSEQREELRARLTWASKFETCDIAEVLEPPAPAPVVEEVSRTPVNHDVEISEGLSVSED